MQLVRPELIITSNTWASVYQYRAKIWAKSENYVYNPSYNRDLEVSLNKHGYSIVPLRIAKKMGYDGQDNSPPLIAPPNDEDYKYPYPGVILPTHLL